MIDHSKGIREGTGIDLSKKPRCNAGVEERSEQRNILIAQFASRSVSGARDRVCVESREDYILLPRLSQSEAQRQCRAWATEGDGLQSQE